MRSRNIFVSLALVFVTSNVASTYSQSLEAQAKALDLITNAADKMCGVVGRAGTSQSSKVKGDIRAQLSGLIKQLADLGVSVDVERNADQYEGVIQADLAAAIQHNDDCKLRVFDKLQEKMIK